MTGKRTSDILTSIIPVVAAICCGPVNGDVVTMSGDSARLSGSVRSISETGAVELASDLSPEPLWLSNEAVGGIGFTTREIAGPAAPALVELVNGDRLPVTIESMDERALVVVSPDAGRLEIPRALLRSLQVGVQNRKRIYQGPGAVNDWASDDPAKKWDFENGLLVANKSSSGARKFELPERFILRFTMKWEQKAQPNFKIYFADPLLEMGVTADRYFMTFNSAGIKIQRESSAGRKYNPLKILNRTPNQFPDNELRVELRVNRETNRIRILLNEVEEDVIPDPVAKAPTGGGIAFEAHPSNNNPLRIGNIEVLEDDDARTRHRGENRGDGKNDSLISNEDDRWSGSLTAIRKTDSGAMFTFKSDFQKDALEIPEASVSTVFFKTPEGGKETAASPFVLRLRGDGAVSLSSCTLGETTASAAHPLLGRLEIGRAGITGLEKPAKRKSPSK